MKAVTFQAPGEVRVDERPEPELLAPDDAIVQVEATGVCGSDLHIYHGRVKIEPGFVIGHEFVGEVIAAGDAVTKVDVGDRVLGCFHTACGSCFFCMRGEYHKCDESRVFGHGATLGSLQGAQAEQVLVPRANLTLRRVPDGMSDDAALFAGDVMGTGYHAVVSAGVRPGDTVVVLGLGPVGLCAAQAARASGAAQVIAVDSVGERLEVAQEFGAQRGAPHRGGPARGGEGGDRRPRGGPRGRRRRPPGRARHGLPHGAQGRNGFGRRRLCGAVRGAHGHRVDQGAHHSHRARERDRARRLRARDDAGGAARPDAARQPSHEARRGARRRTRPTPTAKP